MMKILQLFQIIDMDYSLLMLAISYNYDDAIQLLLERGQDFEYVSSEV